MLALGAGLTPVFPSPPRTVETQDVVTEEAAVCAPVGPALSVTALVREGDTVARGAAVACLRRSPDVCLVAPFGGRVARISLLPGRKLSEIILFRESGADAERHDVERAATPGGLRRLLQNAGVWPLLQRRPFGGMPPYAEVPAAILVMAADTRPFAPDPRRALRGREAEFTRGLDALARLTDGPVLVCQQSGDPLLESGIAAGRVRAIVCGSRHPQGVAGIQSHQVFPAGLDAPVWSIHAEDTASIGSLLHTGELPMTRLVHVAGAALREARSVRTHPGADLRQLTQKIVTPAPHALLSGSPLDGHAAHWLAPRHRQVTALPRDAVPLRRHWLIAAMTQFAAAAPAIPTAALHHALGATIPAAPFIRALSAGDEETAMRYGVLSLLEEDLALADYVLSEDGRLVGQLRDMLDRIQAEFAG